MPGLGSRVPPQTQDVVTPDRCENHAAIGLLSPILANTEVIERTADVELGRRNISECRARQNTATNTSIGRT
jgi:hypothetical protein